MLRVLIAISIAAAGVGCAGTGGITPMDRNSFMVMRQINMSWFGSGPAQQAKAEVYQDANAFCAARNKMVNTISLSLQNAAPYTPASATLQFTCIEPTDDIAPLRREPDKILEIRNK